MIVSVALFVPRPLRMPPEVIVLMPESVTVEEVVVLKRRLLVVTLAPWVEAPVTVVLLPAAQVSLV